MSSDRRLAPLFDTFEGGCQGRPPKNAGAVEASKGRDLRMGRPCLHLTSQVPRVDAQRVAGEA
jgi:hypothetical protein